MMNEHSKSKTLGAFLKSRRNRLQPEQGRELTASKEIIENLGKALQLTQDEKMHLIELWNPNVPDAVSPIHPMLNLQWQNIIEQLSYPSFITNMRTEVLAWNQAAN